MAFNKLKIGNFMRLLQNYKMQMTPDESILEFHFPTVRSKLQNLFPFDPKSDMLILFKTDKFQLQSAYLRLESLFFKNIPPNIAKPIKIEEDFNKDQFQEVMKCFYGGVFKCPRSHIFQVWKILEFLQIESFKKLTIKDIKQSLDKYNFFELMTFAFLNSIEEIFANCLQILDNLNFVQLKKNKDQLLSCPLQVFRFLVNTHNRRSKNKRALSFVEVNIIIGDYCEKNEYSEEFSKDLKFQLIERTELTSEQYRIIFIENGKSQSSKQIPEINFSKKSINTHNQSFLTELAQILTNKSQTVQQKQHWQQKLQNLKNSCQKSQSDHKTLQASADHILKIMKRKSQEAKMKERSLSKMQHSVRQIQKQINQKTQNLKKISQRIQKLQNVTGKGKSRNSKQVTYQEEQQKDQFVESHIIPSNFLGDIINEAQNTKKQSTLKPPSAISEPTASIANFSQKKKNIYESLAPQKQKESSQEYLYKNCLLFDRQPISAPKKYLDSLAKLMDTDDFLKKRQLTLLFRRSKTGNQNIGDPSVIKNRPALLVLLGTSFKKYLGGYISVEIPSFTKSDTIGDYQAFIFSLTHNVKMPIMKGQQKSAVSLSKHYLVSFANDLMISNDCLNQVSYCEWPGVYQVPKNSKCTSARDLIGTNGQFKIESIDIYQVKNQEIQMIM